MFIGDPDVSESIYRLLKAAREGRRLQEEVRISGTADEGGRWLRMRVRPLGESRRIIPQLLDLTHVHNSGAAFGLLNAIFTRDIREGLRFAPYLATLFFFIVVNNIMGIVPFAQISPMGKFAYPVVLAALNNLWPVFHRRRQVGYRIDQRAIQIEHHQPRQLPREQLLKTAHGRASASSERILSMTS